MVRSAHMKTVGTLVQTPFVHLMLWVVESKFTGTLVLARNEIKKSLIFENSRPVSARSNVPDEALGALLIAEGKLTQTQLQKSLQMTEINESVRTGEALIQLGLIDHAYLNEVLRRQFVKRFNDVFTWPDGKYGFVGEIPGDVSKIDVGESLPELCYRALVEKYRESADLHRISPDVKPIAAGRKVVPPAHTEAMRDYVAAFVTNYNTKVEYWRHVFDSLRTSGNQAAVWGGGSKGTMFLNTVKPGDSVACMVDINPRKQGMFVAGAGHPVVSPDQLRAENVSTVIIMNAIYRDEIQKQLGGLGLSPELLVA